MGGGGGVGVGGVVLGVGGCVGGGFRSCLMGVTSVDLITCQVHDMLGMGRLSLPRSLPATQDRQMRMGLIRRQGTTTQMKL